MVASPAWHYRGPQAEREASEWAAWDAARHAAGVGGLRDDDRRLGLPSPAWRYRGVVAERAARQAERARVQELQAAAAFASWPPSPTELPTRGLLGEGSDVVVRARARLEQLRWQRRAARALRAALQRATSCLPRDRDQVDVSPLLEAAAAAQEEGVSAQNHVVGDAQRFVEETRRLQAEARRVRAAVAVVAAEFGDDRVGRIEAEAKAACAAGLHAESAALKAVRQMLLGVQRELEGAARLPARMKEAWAANDYHMAAAAVSEAREVFGVREVHPAMEGARAVEAKLKLDNDERMEIVRLKEVEEDKAELLEEVRMKEEGAAE